MSSPGPNYRDRLQTKMAMFTPASIDSHFVVGAIIEPLPTDAAHPVVIHGLVLSQHCADEADEAASASQLIVGFNGVGVLAVRLETYAGGDVQTPFNRPISREDAADLMWGSKSRRLSAHRRGRRLRKRRLCAGTTESDKRALAQAAPRVARQVTLDNRGAASAIVCNREAPICPHFAPILPPFCLLGR